MTAKPAHEAIEQFVEAIAQHYVARHTDPESGIADKEEFVSAIEQDLRSTLRDRISQLETVKKTVETPTVDLTPSAAELAQPSDHEVSIGEPPTGAASEGTVASAIGDGYESPTIDADASALQQKVTVRSGKEVADLSYGEHAQSKTFAGTTASFSEKLPASPPAGYEILGVLGHGGMGVVYKARHLRLNRVVAIKMIIAGAHASKDHLVRFQREAEAAAHLSHPNIVAIHEVADHDGMPFFSLEFVDGPSVSDLMRETTLTPKRAAELLIPVARAVQYSHEMGILHRDLKPQNILLTSEGQPKVADFGLAKRLDDEDEHKTATGAILGTPGYMAPEQARSKADVGPQVDVYALGCILYYMMTGRPPFAAPTPFETVRQTLMTDPVSPSKLQIGLDKDLETICLKALEKSPEKRYASAQEFADELQRFLDGKPIVARPITTVQRGWKWCKRNPRVASLSGLAASLLLCLLVGGLVASVVINEQKKAEQVARKQAEDSETLAADQAELALDTTRLVLYETKDFFAAKPELRPLRESMIGAILEGVEQIHTDRYSKDVRSTFVASADSQLGQIYLDAGAFEKAREKLLGAQQKLRELNADGTLNRAAISQMNLTLALGDTYRGLGELEQAEAEYQSLLKQRQDYFEGEAKTVNKVLAEESLAEVYGRLCRISSDRGDPKEALRYGLRAVKARRAGLEARPQSQAAMLELSGALSELSRVYERAGDHDQMMATNHESMELFVQAAESRSDVATLHNTAVKQKATARKCLKQGLDEQSLDYSQQATETFERLLKLSDNQKSVAQAAEAYYWTGVARKRLAKDDAAAYRRAAELQQTLIEKSDNVDTRGMLLKIQARAGQLDEAEKSADEMAAKSDQMMSCGYAAVAYALLTEHVDDDRPEHAEWTAKAIELTRKLIRDHNYRDFSSLRTTDLDFEPLQDNQDFLEMLNAEEAKLASN